MVIPIYKPLGKTPYEMVKLIKQLKPELQNEKIGYAGRLDPMAHGVLLLLVGDENKHKHRFEGLTKEYEFEMICGIKTDSYDLLGKIVQESNKDHRDIERNFKKLISTFNGPYIQTYPPYSAIRLNGKPLYYWQLRGLLKAESIPKKEVMIHSLKLISTNLISAADLESITKERISGVLGNFRQKEILETWQNFFQNNNTTSFFTAKLFLTCSSGTYVRSIVQDLGEKLGTTATTLSILRTAVGEYTLKQCLVMA